MDSSVLVKRFAALLGWNGIQRKRMSLEPHIYVSLPPGTVATYWSTTDSRFFIHINQSIAGQFGAYRVCVVPDRYDIGPTDFVDCRFANAVEAANEAKRLAPLLARTHFRDRIWRRRYLERNPTKLLHPKKRWRGWKCRLRTEQRRQRGAAGSA